MYMYICVWGGVGMCVYVCCWCVYVCMCVYVLGVCVDLLLMAQHVSIDGLALAASIVYVAIVDYQQW